MVKQKHMRMKKGSRTTNSDQAARQQQCGDGEWEWETGVYGEHRTDHDEPGQPRWKNEH